MNYRVVETVEETEGGVEGFTSGPTSRDQRLIYSPTFKSMTPFNSSFPWSRSFFTSTYYNRPAGPWKVINFHFLWVINLRHTWRAGEKEQDVLLTFMGRLGNSYFTLQWSIVFLSSLVQTQLSYYFCPFYKINTRKKELCRNMAQMKCI